jgi:subtilisin family serine protease
MIAWTRRWKLVAILMLATVALGTPPAAGHVGDAQSVAGSSVGNDPRFVELDLPLEKAAPGDFLGFVADDVGVTAWVIDESGAAASVARAARDVSGLHVVDVAPQGAVIHGKPDQLRRLLKPDGSIRIERDWEFVPAATSEGVAVSGADVWQADGSTGEGVKVAIVDGGFDGYSSLLGTELPDVVEVVSFAADGATDASKHGTAVAEIVHDVAPGAEFHLVAVEKRSDLEGAVDYLIANDIDVVNMSGGWTVGPFDGTSFVSSQVARAVGEGVIWVNAAGNYADTHWGGLYRDDDLDDFADLNDAGDEFNGFLVGPGASFSVGLTWDSGASDLDMCLVDLDAVAVVACSVGEQLPGDPPIEFIPWTSPYGYVSAYAWAVVLFSGVPGNMDVHVSGETGPVDFPVAAGSVADPAVSPAAVAVGAVNWNSPTTLTSYSSQGPTTDGRTKPDFVAPTMVSTFTYGSEGFSGTSASSPLVAGLAALLLEADPSLDPTGIRSRLTDMALALPSGSGMNNQFGHGLAKLAPPPRVERLAGGDRFATAAAISEAEFLPGVDVAYVATGLDFPDALAGGPVAAVNRGPILLVGRDTIPSVTARELNRLKPGRVVILGGSGVVSASVETQLAGYVDGP